MNGADPGPIPDFLRALSADERAAAWRDFATYRTKGETDVKTGPKEEQLRALKAERTAAPAPARAQPKAAQAAKETTMISPTTATTEKPKTAPKTPRKAATKKAAPAKKPAKAESPKKEAAPKKPSNGAKEVRPGSKLEMIGKMLARPEGCTMKAVLDATKWPSCSLPQQARALGVKLKKEKVDGVTVYRAA